MKAKAPNVNENRRIPMRAIRAVAKQIAEKFQPEKIILFGSYAYGKPRPESDVDLLVVMETSLRERQQRLEISRALSPRPFCPGHYHTHAPTIGGAYRAGRCLLA